METINPAGYLPRVVDAQVQRCLRIYGAVEISGAKWCGKTWTARHHANSIVHLDESNALAAAKAAPELVLEGDKPRVIDEWQLAPNVWDAVRHAVDEAAEKGLWILTGSSTPAYSKTRHSGAGRFGRVRMRPMSLFESEDSVGAVSLEGLFAGKFSPAQTGIDVSTLAELCCRGGWPGVLGFSASDAQQVARDYLEAALVTSVPAQGKDSATARRLLRSLARNLGQLATYKTLVADMYGQEPGQIAPRTVGEYLDVLNSLFLIEPVGGWAPPARSPKRFQTKERRYFIDPSLPIVLLRLNEHSLQRDFQTFGLVFENLCLRDLAVYSEALGATLRYYRDDAGLEVDAIIETSSQEWAACEIKLGENKVDKAAKKLVRLREKLLRNPANQVKPPAFLAVITGLGQYAYQRQDGVYVIPITTLRP